MAELPITYLFIGGTLHGRRLPNHPDFPFVPRMRQPIMDQGHHHYEELYEWRADRKHYELVGMERVCRHE